MITLSTGSQSNLKRLGTIILATLVALVGVLQFVMPAQAADFTNAYIRLDRMTATTSGNVLVIFTVPVGNVGDEAKITVDFGAGTTVAANPTVNTSNLPAGAIAVPGTLAATGAGQVVTITGVTDLSATTTYGVNIATGVTNGSAAQYKNTITTLTSGDVAIDSKEVATRVVSNDQIVVSAVVPPTFSFSLGANIDSFSTDLDPSGIVSTAGVTATIATNASNGWVAWVSSANVALSSASTSNTISSSGTVDGTPTTLSSGSEDYALDVNLTQDSATASTGAVTIAAEYNGGATQGGTLTTALSPIASADGPTDDDQITLVEKATISGLTPAGNDYTDTLTVIGAGNF